MSPSPGMRLPQHQPESVTGLQSNGHPHPDRSASPPAPPYSPITPVLTTSDLAPGNGAFTYGPPPDPTPRPPPPAPFSEEDNSDAMALRSAISILQIQRQQSLRDMKLLEQQKKLAVADAKGFAASVMAGRIKSTGAGALVVGPDPGTYAEESTNGDDMDGDHIGEGEEVKHIPEESKFADLPAQQNIVRCPPINWSKYHVVGESLDKLHEEQRRRPTSGEPHTDDEPARPPEHVIAAPYNPWTDKLSNSPMRTSAHKDG